MARIAVEGVTKRYGQTVALDAVDLSVDDGEFLVLLGPSGCGKTTLLRIIAGLVEPTAGRVVVGDRDVTALPPRARDVAMVFQSYALYPHLSVERNLAFGLRVRRRPKQEIAHRVGEVAGQLALDALLSRRPKQLSGGQRQRVALGRAMVRDPLAFLMDEPLSNLDAQLRTATRLELAALHRRLGTTFVYVTHDQIEAMTMATRIAVLNGGRLEQVGTPADVYDWPATTFVARFVGAPGMNLLEATALSRDGVVRVVADGFDAALERGHLAARPVLVGVRPERLRLDTATSGPRCTGRVVAVENVGSEEVALVRCGPAHLSWRGPRPLGVRPGDDVRLTTDRAHLHLFDPASTRRLVWVDDPLAARPNLAGARA
ncbi:MAG: ABC transporter ATP-binding protein [Actinomycetota bacterium]|nr:ABC transporter ATP-binding protein [Actinomycetota bacterium]